MHTSPTPLGPGREFDAIRDMLARWGALATGIGDDAALLDVLPGHRVVVSTDVAVEHVHFRGDWLTPREIGWRATAAALSDLAAMAARPIGLLTAVTLPREWRQHLGQLSEGIADAAAFARAPIVGGDISGGAHLALCVTVLGTVRTPLLRSGARPGDTVWVTGRLGGPGAALNALQSGREPGSTARLRFAHPVPRLTEAEWLARRGVTCGIDISDGLAGDLAHVAAASDVAIQVDLERVPIVDDTEPLAALGSGEEYELAVAGPSDLDAAEFERTFGLGLTRIGRVVSASDGGRIMVLSHGTIIDVPRGYDHLAR